MRPLILIVEDNPLIALALDDLVQDALDSQSIIVRTVSEAMNHITESLALALLDIEVADGLVFPIARMLRDKRIPFIFVSSLDRNGLPEDLTAESFLAKTAPSSTLVQLARTLMSDKTPLIT